MFTTFAGNSAIMINVTIYLDSQKDAKELAVGLMKANLLAHASIDKDNHSLFLHDGEIVEQSNFVITGQTKALLFTEIPSYIDTHCNENIKVFSVPITQCNENFSEIIRENVRKI
jgi:uncharacterized protein involved in tolerance to divalent cations